MMLFFLFFLFCVVQAASFSNRAGRSCSVVTEHAEDFSIYEPGFEDGSLPIDHIFVDYYYSWCCRGVSVDILLVITDPESYEDPKTLSTAVLCETSSTTLYLPSSYTTSPGKTINADLIIAPWNSYGTLTAQTITSLTMAAPALTSSDIPSSTPSATPLEASPSTTTDSSTVAQTTGSVKGTPPTSTALPKNTISDETSEDGGLSASQKAGISVGVISAVALFLSGILLLIRHHQKMRSTNPEPVDGAHEDDSGQK